MFRKETKDFAFIFPFKKPRRLGVTMFFVFFPIDILFLDHNNVIIEIKENLRPFSSYVTISKKVYSMVELPLGSVKKHKLILKTAIDWDEYEGTLLKTPK